MRRPAFILPSDFTSKTALASNHHLFGHDHMLYVYYKCDKNCQDG